jgi:hypothetical protein
MTAQLERCHKATKRDRLCQDGNRPKNCAKKDEAPKLHSALSYSKMGAVLLWESVYNPHLYISRSQSKLFSEHQLAVQWWRAEGDRVADTFIVNNKSWIMIEVICCIISQWVKAIFPILKYKKRFWSYWMTMQLLDQLLFAGVMSWLTTTGNPASALWYGYSQNCFKTLQSVSYLWTNGTSNYTRNIGLGISRGIYVSFFP